MATYVAYRAKPAGLALNDYRLLDDPDEVSKRFDMARRLMLDLGRAARPELTSVNDRLSREGNQQRVTYIVGAAMARRIEQVHGRAKLIGTVAGGPQTFLQAYRGTSPPRSSTYNLSRAYPTNCTTVSI